MQVEGLFLGTGTSVGVPMIGCECSVCTSADPRDWRNRASLYLNIGGKGLLFDTGPDLRIACLKWKVPRVDAICITHLHADHIFGFDDIRRFNTMQEGQVIPCFAGPETIQGMHRIFPYITPQPNVQGLYRPQIDFIAVTEVFQTLGATVTPLPLIHGSAETYGYRIDIEGKSLAYLPDVHEIPESTFALLCDLDVLILNLLRERYHATHLTAEQSIAYAHRIAAKRTYCTHFSHDFTHCQWLMRLPQPILPAYDGLRFTLSEE